MDIIYFTAAPKKLGYYKFYSTPATWFGAKKICEQEGTRLLVLNSEREFITIKGVWDTYPKLFPDDRNKYLHIALHDLLEEGLFITLDGKDFNIHIITCIMPNLIKYNNNNLNNFLYFSNKTLISHRLIVLTFLNITVKLELNKLCSL